MKIYAPLTLAPALFLTACASSSQDDAKAGSQTAATHTYQCESGETITATYPSNTSAVIQHKGAKHTMQIAVSASGSRYVGNELEWWTKGSGPGAEAALLHHKPDGTSGKIIENCAES
ncbi:MULTISPECIES: MliC family protein [Marinobacter]|uniref:MliC family protein n=1 Tax=Marinobacter xiaoshiensis TaxID=3073652 RepID=A0ABU2HIH0_9GAMM|nr:MliC family protein [Marinobacter sp. F60267]MDS1310110.1 MliC family protein [Marinobacter sp. F60267]